MSLDYLAQALEKKVLITCIFLLSHCMFYYHYHVFWILRVQQKLGVNN